MKLDKHYQLAAIQHTMRCLRGCIDTLEGPLVEGTDFVGKRYWIMELDTIREKVKGMETRAYEERGRSL